eukprot:gene195-234_t
MRKKWEPKKARVQQKSFETSARRYKNPKDDEKADDDTTAFKNRYNTSTTTTTTQKYDKEEDVIDEAISSTTAAANEDKELAEEKSTFHPYREGWLLNMKPSSSKERETGIDKASIELFFIQDDATSFRAWVTYNPYFYVYVKDGHHAEVEAYLKRKYEQKIAAIEIVDKEDLDLENHLSGLRRKYLKIKFHNVQTLLEIRSELAPVVKRNLLRQSTSEAYDVDVSRSSGMVPLRKTTKMATEYILDLREYDVTYYQRAAIDLGFRVGTWYTVTRESPTLPTVVAPLTTREERPEPRVLAFDIETTKLPLKFPDAKIDSIMMISYMLDRQGFLIVNREIVSQDIGDFEYTPRPEYEGQFTVFNEADEEATLQRFFSHVRKSKPHIFVTYNGDMFDWPFVDARARVYGMDLWREIGVRAVADGDEYRARTAVHMDAFCWVKRDSYLPQGSQGLKEVTRKKLRYNPLEVDPEDMLRFASEQPDTLATYSVSDAVATYYLYMTYIHPFIFSLCNIIPLNPDDVLRKGSGTLCEALLMSEATRVNVIYPNKYTEDKRKMFKGHLLESETYVGGHVECLESGVFRHDIATHFSLDADALAAHIANVDGILHQAMKEVGIHNKTDLTNYNDMREDILARLEKLKATPIQTANPLIYHLDVSAMYPNIILTNRLQPTSIVSEEDCATCTYNKPENNCKRNLNWEWRGDYTPSSHSEYRLISQQLESENLPVEEQDLKLRQRLKEYSKKVYKKTHMVSSEIRSDTVCMRENSFYVDTVRSFRDRRYVYKDLHSTWKGNYDTASKGSGPHDLGKCQNMVVMYESMQLAHKCILNSFYGYVMRKGSRWYSMQMAGIVTHTGSNIIKRAREAVEQLGRPLELDTDGIWCILPAGFPEEYSMQPAAGGRAKRFNFLNALLNAKVASDFTNHQYQEFDTTTGTYNTRDECSILFESDGPYGCMFIPTSKEKDVKLKKRYAVFNKQGGVCELKGFEIKRRGELELIKSFQTELFQHFGEGSTLDSAYGAIASVANRWLDVLDSHADGYEEKELIRLITESSKMSKTLEEYDRQKSSAVGTALKLREFLGADIVKDAGLSCRYIIARTPAGAPVTERTLPVDIFAADQDVREHFLRRWTKSRDVNLRDIIDWDYYRTRLSGVIQKMITLPAALQDVANPVPRVAHPDWIMKRMKDARDSRQQTNITSFFSKVADGGGDIEDMFKKRFENMPTPVFTKHKRPTDGSDSKDSKRKKRLSSKLDGFLTRDKPIDDSVKPPGYDSDPSGWVAFMKPRWRRLRDRIKARKAGRSHPDDQVNFKQSGFFSSSNDAIKKGLWQIISIAETSVPGAFVFWALIGEMMVPIKVTIARQFYLNSLQPDPYEGGEKHSGLPPRGKPRYYLSEHVMPEIEYKARAKELSTLFTQPQIEGVYETQVPLALRAVISIGCMASLRINTKNTAKITLGDIVMRPERSTSYLAEQNFNTIYLYANSRDGRDGMFALVRSHNSTATIILANPYGAANIQKTSRLLAPLIEKYPELTFEMEVANSMEAARRAVNSQLQAYAAQRKGATIIISQLSNIGQSDAMNAGIPMLKEFPQVTMAAHEGDASYSHFNWDIHSIAPFIKRYAEVAPWWRFYVSLARYSNVPIGSLGRDYASLVSDISYGRALKEAGHLLWLSHSNCPDLGGSEEDDAKFHEELAKVEVNVPDCYNSVCIELSLTGLAVNTILESNHLADIEGIIGSELNTQPSIGEDPKLIANQRGMEHLGGCEREFNILRKIVTKWSLDLAMGGRRRSNQNADMLLTHFYRWISSPYSGLYDPVLHRTLHGFMRKVFLQLLFELRKLGARIVYANFNKLVICTNKNTMEDAQQYTSFILSVIKKKELFNWLDLKPSVYWHNLLWMDQGNFGGIQHNPDNATTGTPSSVSPDTATNTSLIAHWNIGEFLPASIQTSFDLIISDFVRKLYMHRENLRINEAMQEAKERETQVEEDVEDAQQTEDSMSTKPSTTSTTASTRKSVAPKTTTNWNDEEDREVTPYKWDMVVDHDRIVHILQEMRYADSNDAAFQFPVRPGSHLTMTKPTLEFVKMVCHVLGLDKTLTAKVMRLRKNLMRMVDVREFSEEAKFVDPCLSFVLPDVICPYCYSCRDIDLLRDATATNNHKLTCNTCGNIYNKDLIESTLVEIVQRRSLSYHLQDLKCSKCAVIKSDNLSDICATCSEEVMMDNVEDVEDVVVEMELAEVVEMVLVEDVETVLEEVVEMALVEDVVIKTIIQEVVEDVDVEMDL